MNESRKQFVAEDLWMVIGVLTFGLAGLSSVLGLPALTPVIGTVGWFILTPLFLFWGEEIADYLYDAEADSAMPAAEDDAVEELKRRYARGEIDETEFERRLDRLVELDERGNIQPGTTRTGSETNREREYELE